MGKWYLCGPMSGIPQFNIPEFNKVAWALREQEFDIVSPAELDEPEFQQDCLASVDGKLPPGGKTWGDFLSRDVKLVADTVDGIILLPGWLDSRGARLEAFVGLLTDKEFAAYDPLTHRALLRSTEWVRTMLRYNMP